MLDFVFRLLAASQPSGLLYVSMRITGLIVAAHSRHRAIPNCLWWPVIAEVVIAVPGNNLTRASNYLDSLADKCIPYASGPTFRSRFRPKYRGSGYASQATALSSLFSK